MFSFCKARKQLFASRLRRRTLRRRRWRETKRRRNGSPGRRFHASGLVLLEAPGDTHAELGTRVPRQAWLDWRGFTFPSPSRCWCLTASNYFSCVCIYIYIYIYIINRQIRRSCFGALGAFAPISIFLSKSTSGHLTESIYRPSPRPVILQSQLTGPHTHPVTLQSQLTDQIHVQSPYRVNLPTKSTSGHLTESTYQPNPRPVTLQSQLTDQIHM